MKPYGVNPKQDQDCCPGHSLFPRSTYRNRRSKKAQSRDTKIAHRRERHRVRSALRVAIGAAGVALMAGCSDLNHLTGIDGPPMCKFGPRTTVDTTWKFVTAAGDTVMLTPGGVGTNPVWYTTTITFPAGLYPCDSK